MERNEFIERLITFGEGAWNNAKATRPRPSDSNTLPNPVLVRARSSFDSRFHDAITLGFDNPNGIYNPDFLDTVFTIDVDRCAPILLRFVMTHQPHPEKAIFRSPMIIKDENGCFGWSHEASHFDEYAYFDGTTGFSVEEHYGTRVLETHRLDLALADAAKKHLQLVELHRSDIAEKSAKELEYIDEDGGLIEQIENELLAIQRLKDALKAKLEAKK